MARATQGGAPSRGKTLTSSSPPPETPPHRSSSAAQPELYIYSSSATAGKPATISGNDNDDASRPEEGPLRTHTSTEAAYIQPPVSSSLTPPLTNPLDELARLEARDRGRDGYAQRCSRRIRWLSPTTHAPVGFYLFSRSSSRPLCKFWSRRVPLFNLSQARCARRRRPGIHSDIVEAKSVGGPDAEAGVGHVQVASDRWTWWGGRRRPWGWRRGGVVVA